MAGAHQEGWRSKCPIMSQRFAGKHTALEWAELYGRTEVQKMLKVHDERQKRQTLKKKGAKKGRQKGK